MLSSPTPQSHILVGTELMQMPGCTAIWLKGHGFLCSETDMRQTAPAPSWLGAGNGHQLLFCDFWLGFIHCRKEECEDSWH